MNFAQATFLNAFEINELFFQVINLPDWSQIRIENHNQCSEYLCRINFFSQLSNIRGITNETTESPHAGLNDGLTELSIYKHKPEFYGDQERINTVLSGLGLSKDIIIKVANSLSEIVDNAFSHNLGQWSLQTGPLVSLIAQKYKYSNKSCLLFSICDFGGGFRNSLLANYPDLKDEKEAINSAIQPNLTGRPQRKGGNGLFYLQRETFNGFKGSLIIRSGNTISKVEKKLKTTPLNEKLPFNYGSNVFFSLQLL
ncbi:MAG: hypothetical protein SFT81_03575 [Candidatus Caenarcaniphilales bacterium]|nr:hypothetical protein [Candidatus Caenarcaniphilales bacterium]